MLLPEAGKVPVSSVADHRFGAMRPDVAQRLAWRLKCEASSENRFISIVAWADDNAREGSAAANRRSA